MDSSGTGYMNLILNIAPEYVKGCELQEGEWVRWDPSLTGTMSSVKTVAFIEITVLFPKSC